MPDCDYCGESFDDGAAHRDHLAAAHADELGPIDRRKAGLDADADDADGVPVGAVVLVGIFAVVTAVVGYVVVGAGTDSDVGAPGSAHYHGTIEVVVTGDRVDFSRDRYQNRADRFHFEAGDGEQWHAHATGVTLAFAMETLGIEVTEDAVTFEGATYADGDGYAVTVAVDGDPVTPAAYVLREGDHVRIVVEEA